MRNLAFILVSGCICLLCAGLAGARTITVDDDAAADFATIQAAIDAASHGDTVEIQPGTYMGEGNRNLDFLGTAITVRSIDPDDPDIVEATIIDCNDANDSYRGFDFHSGEGPDCTIAGLTITRGGLQGGGIRCLNSGPRILNCRFVGNHGALDCENASVLVADCVFSSNSRAHGGAIFNMNSSLVLDNCTFEANRAALRGGALCNENSNVSATNCRFVNNVGDDGGAVYNEQGRITFLNCSFFDNSFKLHGTVSNDQSDPLFTNCLFSRTPESDNSNRGEDPLLPIFTVGDSNPVLSNCTLVGRSIGVHVPPQRSSSEPVIRNCIFWNTVPFVGMDTPAVVTYSNIRGGYPGEGNIDADPCFAGADWGNYRLEPHSLCVNAGDNDAVAGAVLTDLMGNQRIADSRVDMGCYEYAGPTTIYVDSNASGQNNGKSWADAYTELQPALNSALAGDEILVAGGVYPPGVVPGIDYPWYLTGGEVPIGRNGQPMWPLPMYERSKYNYFGLRSGVAVVGGYAGAAGGDPNERNIRLYETVLTGDPNGRDSENMTAYATIRNSYHVVVARDLDEAVVLDGLTITGGYNYLPTASASPDDPDGTGAGMHIEDCSAIIRNCTFKRNSGEYGGGVYCLNAETVFANCIFTANTGDGAAIYSASGDITLENCTITRNLTVEESGAIAGRSLLLKSYWPPPLYGPTTFSVSNCIVYDNFPSEISLEAEKGSIVYSNIKGGWPGEGNIDVDPLVTRDGYLRAGSPCIDAGDPNHVGIVGGICIGGEGRVRSKRPDPEEPNCAERGIEVDIDLEARIGNGRIDMGADEFFDSDGDGLPDAFESEHFGDPCAADPYFDADDDTWINIAEYENGTIPNVQPIYYYVDPNLGSSDYDGLAPEWDGEHGPFESIQTAVGRCRLRHNDNVILSEATHDARPPGTFVPKLPVYGKALTIRSSDPADPCVVAGTIVIGHPRAFTFDENEGPGTLVEGITIADGNALERCQYSGNCNYDPRSLYHDEPHGGGILCRFADPTIRGCVIRNNNAETQGGGIFVEQAKPLIINCIIRDNTSGERGGGIHANNASPFIIDCTITDNKSYTSDYHPYIPHYGRGGAISCGNNESPGGSPMIRGCTITDNFAPGGAAIYVRDGSPTITNCIIAGNYGDDYGAVYLSDDSNSSITNCTIVGNSHGGVYHRGDGVEIVNSIIWANRGSSITDVTGGVSARYSNVEGGFAGPAVVDIVPGFADPGRWRLNSAPEDPNHDPNDMSWVHGDYHLKSEAWRWDPNLQTWTWDYFTSQCVDTGDPSFSLGDEPLTIPLDPTNYWGINLYINKGAYGGTVEASIPPHDWVAPDDYYSNDGVFSFADYAAWANDFVYIKRSRPYVVIADLRELTTLCRRWLETKWDEPSSRSGASYPWPVDGAVDVSSDTVLAWQPNAYALSYDVYFDTMNPPRFRTNQTTTTFDLGHLYGGEIHYWRIDIHSVDGLVTGAVWSFMPVRGKTQRCFPGDTLVWIDGETAEISNVAAGSTVDKPSVTATITELYKEVCAHTVEDIDVHDECDSWERYDIVFENGNSLAVADSHYLLLDSGKWACVENVAAGSKLSTLEGSVTVKSITKTKSSGTVYNLKIKDSDRYLVGKDGIIVRDW